MQNSTIRNLLICALALGFTTSVKAQNTSTTDQQGSDNSARVDQTGSNTATVEQGASGAAVSDNIAVIIQVGENTATVSQFGSRNEGVIYQGRIDGFGDATAMFGNKATVTQTGSDNTGFTSNNALGDGGIVYQGTSGGTASDVASTVVQTGSAGRAATAQGFNNGSATNSTIELSQGGLDNIALARQGGFTLTSANDEAVITQTSSTSLNVALISQGDRQDDFFPPVPTATEAGSEDSYASIYQNGGTRNDARMYQVGIENRSVASQDGSQNVFSSVQMGDGHDSELMQNGSRNRASVQQMGDGNTSDVMQSGSRNNATVVQN